MDVAWIAGDGFTPNIRLTKQDVDDLDEVLSHCTVYGRNHAAIKAEKLRTKLGPMLTAHYRVFGDERNQDPWMGPGPGTVD